MKSTDIRVVELRESSQRIAYRTPMKFGGRVVRDVILQDVSATVETRQGKRATGFGSMPLGNVWAWPSQVVSAEDTLQAMVRLARSASVVSDAAKAFGHPLEITRRLTPHWETLAQEASGGLAESMPPLAMLVAVSPIEAAIHDAYGKVHEASSYDLLGESWVNADLASYLDDTFQGEYLDRYTLRRPQPSMPLYHLVGALDPLSDADVVQRIGDGLPETLGEWIVADELTHLKIKLNGDDLAWDVQRVAAIEEVSRVAQQQRGCLAWCYSLDFNEKCANVEYVLDFLAKLNEASPAALERVQYIEQPTHRDLRSNPENRMHQAAKIKPVVIDESLIDYESLLLAREQGYSGVALKACKGQSEALLMGAAAQKHGLFLCVQDLTCVGASFLHSASLAARVPGVAAIEGNGRQYCPAGNEGWEGDWPGMFQVAGGRVQTGLLDGFGLGGWERPRP